MRRLLAAGSALGLLAHNAFETRAGVGLVFEPFLGRRGAVALWSAYFPLMLAAAARDGENARRLSAFSAGIGVAGVAVHFKAWPWSLHGGLPMLDEAEGLSDDQLPAYNAVLWFWLLCSVLSLPAANRPGARRFAIFGLLNFPGPARLGAPSLRLGARAGPARAGALESGPARAVTDAAPWPGGARGALSLSFDNLGEAAELELGAIAPGTPLGGHFTATDVLPALLDRLAERGLAATFFVEGINAEIYPELLLEIAARGHELAFHAWRHEQWAELPAAAQAENLARCQAGFDRLGLEAVGLRPPGGQLGAGGLDVLRRAGLRYCSPAGSEAGEDRGIALLPFQWRHLDASCVLPPLADVREQIAGAPDPVDPGAFVASLEQGLEAIETGGFLTFVLHPFMLGWLGDENLAALLDRIAAGLGLERPLGRPLRRGRRAGPRSSRALPRRYRARRP